MNARAFVSGLAMIAMACGGDTSDGTPSGPVTTTPVLTTIVVTITAPNLTIKGAEVAKVSGLDQNGAAVAIGPVTWSSSDPSVATIDSTGLIRGVAAGQAQIIASYGGKTGAGVITVAAGPVWQISLSSELSTIPVGATLQLTVSVTDSSGNELAGLPIVWSSSDVRVATVGKTGLVTGLSEGRVVILVLVNGYGANALVTVGSPPVKFITMAPQTRAIAVGSTQSYSAIVQDSTEAILQGRTITYASSNPSIASGSLVGNVYTVTGLALGVDTITATSEGKSVKAVLTISPVSVVSVNISPPIAFMTPHNSRVFIAQAVGSSGDFLNDRGFVWTSSDTTVVNVVRESTESAAVVVPIAAGTAKITVTSEGKSASSNITVTGSSSPKP